MKLKSITPHLIGPFVNGPTIEFEPDITVIVGANDAGKSKLLRAIELATVQYSSLEQHEINDTHLGQLADNWNMSTSYYIEAAFSPSSIEKDDPFWKNKKEFTYRKQVSPSETRSVNHVYVMHDGSPSTDGRQVNLKLNVVNTTNLGRKINDSISLNSKSEIEKRLLKICLGENISSTSYKTIAEVARKTAARAFSKKISESVRRATFGKFKYFIDIDFGSDASSIQVRVRDEMDVETVLSKRGSGVQAVISNVIILETLDANTDNLFLFDEPDQTLHPDYQRMLRQVFAHYAKRPNMQIVYSTHSPQMINNLKPSQIRILKSSDGIERSPIVEKRESGTDFAQVRHTLGVLPSDSLSFADVVLLIEGESEFRCMDLLIRKMIDPDRWAHISDGLVIMSGNGDSLPKYARICKKMGCHVVVLVDGDKHERTLGQIREHVADDDVIQLPINTEIEDCVDSSIYIMEALKYLELDDEALMQAARQVHDEVFNGNTKGMFSKRVEQAVKKLEKSDEKYIRSSKVSVFEKAIHQSSKIQENPSVLKVIQRIEKASQRR